MIPAGGTRSWQVIVPALVLHLALVALLGDWIMDDAGISYAYAENLAEGHGLVSQPGRPPVEGYSNFLWVLVLAGLFSVGLFEPVVAVKILAAVFVLLSLWLLRRALSAHLSERALALLLILVASAPPLVIWATSGLENSLTMLLAAALYDQLVRQPGRWEIQRGVLTALLAMNHPENASSPPPRSSPTSLRLNGTLASHAITSR